MLKDILLKSLPSVEIDDFQNMCIAKGYKTEIEYIDDYDMPRTKINIFYEGNILNQTILDSEVIKKHQELFTFIQNHCLIDNNKNIIKFY